MASKSPISTETVEVNVTYDRKTTFFLRMIGIAEENQLRQKAFGLTDDEKAEKEYETNVQILKDLSAKLPAGLYPNKPESTSTKEQAESSDTFIEDFSDPADAIAHFFNERSVIKERIAYFAVRGYFVRLQPSESFL